VRIDATDGPFEKEEAKGEDNPSTLPTPKPPSGETPTPPPEDPPLDDAQQARREEVDRYIAEEIYQGATIVDSVALPSGDVVDFLDRSTLPALPYGLPSVPTEDLTLPPGVELGMSELEQIPELIALASTATPFHRPTFWPYIMGETDATSVEDYLDRYTVGGQPTSSEHLYAGFASLAPNRGVTGFMNQFRPQVEQGSFSLMEFAVACPEIGVAQELIGGVISVDKLNPFGTNGQALTDGEPRMHIEFAHVDPATGQIRYNWDGSRGEFVANPLRARHRPGETVPVSVLGGAQMEHLFTVFQSPNGDWWIVYQGELLGYYPASLFTMLNGGACRTHFYGEVARWKPAAPTGWVKTEMGSGKFPEAGNLSAAYVRNPRYYDSLWLSKNAENAPITKLATKPKCYNQSELGPGTIPGERVFYLGGPGGNDPACVWP